MKDFEPLDILQEECAEVIQSISKIRRFGWDNFNPFVPVEQQKSNRNHLIEEIGDALAVIDIVQQIYNLDPMLMLAAKTRKIEKLKKWSTIYDEDQESKTLEELDLMLVGEIEDDEDLTAFGPMHVEPSKPWNDIDYEEPKTKSSWWKWPIFGSKP